MPGDQTERVEGQRESVWDGARVRELKCYKKGTGELRWTFQETNIIQTES